MNNTINKERSYGIDLLKILSMFMVIMIHVTIQGGIIDSSAPSSVNYWLSTLLSISVFCAVNCFALTSGYLMGNEEYKFKYRKIVSLWVVVFFYTAVFLVIGLLFFRDMVTQEEILHLFPVVTMEYWYFTAYFCMFFFIPILNKVIELLPKKVYYLLLLTGFVMLSAFPYSFPIDTGFFGAGKGYSTWWLMYLYLMGAGIRKHGLFTKISRKKACIGYVCTTILAWLSKIIITFVIGLEIPLMSRVFEIYKPDRLISYDSPLILLQSIFVLLICVKSNVPKKLHKPMAKISPMIFQIMIIHMNFLIWGLFIGGKFGIYASLNPVLMILATIGTAVVIFVVCLIIDWIRIQLFRLLRVNKIINLVADKIYEKYSNSKLKKKINNWFELND